MAGSLLVVMAMLLTGASAVTPSLKGSQASMAQQGARRSRITIGMPQVQHHLTICNAYHATAPLEILHVDQHVWLTKDKPLKYKDCQEFTLPLLEGDRLDFKSGGTEIGTFHATSMPKASTSLLLIPRHREGSARALTFESHAFADLKNPQIAVVDAYRGNETSTVNIVENLNDVEAGKAALTEALRFNSVVAVAPGKYNIALMGSTAKGADIKAMPINAAARSKCVIMRVGGQGLAFPQELVVFSNSAASRWISTAIAMVVAVLLMIMN